MISTHKNCVGRWAPANKFSYFSSYTIAVNMHVSLIKINPVCASACCSMILRVTRLSLTCAHWGKVKAPMKHETQKKKYRNELNDNDLPVLPKSVLRATPVFVDLTRLGSVPFLPQHLMRKTAGIKHTQWANGLIIALNLGKCVREQKISIKNLH